MSTGRKEEIFESSPVTLVGEYKEQLLNEEPGVPIFARYSYLAIMRQRYQELTTKILKTNFLNEVMKVTKLNRSYITRVFWHQAPPERKENKRQKQSKYTIIIPLIKELWKKLNRCGGKKLYAAVPDWIGFLDATREEKCLLIKISASEIDRILKPIRAEHRRKNNTGTIPSKHRIKTEVPIKPLGNLPNKPGYMEIDTVAHCGESMSGQFFWTLTSVDIFTRWTIIRPVWTKESKKIRHALEEMESELPYHLLGLYMDCGSEFLNEEVISNYALDKTRDRKLIVGRSRPYKKNDQCFVEQKNSTHVLQLLGYGRFGYSNLEGKFRSLFDDWNKLQNYFVPQVNLTSKVRNGSKISRRYSVPKTAFERVLENPDVRLADKDRLIQEKASINPVQLSDTIRKKLSEIHRIQETHKNLQGRMAS